MKTELLLTITIVTLFAFQVKSQTKEEAFKHFDKEELNYILCFVDSLMMSNESTTKVCIAYEKYFERIRNCKNRDGYFKIIKSNKQEILIFLDKIKTLQIYNLIWDDYYWSNIERTKVVGVELYHKFENPYFIFLKNISKTNSFAKKYYESLRISGGTIDPGMDSWFFSTDNNLNFTNYEHRFIVAVHICTISSYREIDKQ